MTARAPLGYPELLALGERFEREGLSWRDRLSELLQLLGTAPSGRDAAVSHGLVVRNGWPHRGADALADLTGDSITVASTLAAAQAEPEEALQAIADLAAGLMLVTPVHSSDAVRTLHAGHALASGWLAVHLFHAGVRAAPGTREEALATRQAP